MARPGVKNRKTEIDSSYAESLLFPIAAFLRAGGLNLRTSMRAFSTAYNKSAPHTKNRQIDHIGHPTIYADIISTWMRDERFVGTNGRARVLPFQGRASFSTLIKTVAPSHKAKQILDVLTRYGTVRRLKKNRCQLAIPFFFTTANSRIAFEPAAYFLSDASATLGQLVKKTTKNRRSDLFWRKVESVNLSKESARELMAFLRERSVMFLEEIDDWIDAKTTRRRTGIVSKRKHLRVGLGLFSFQDSKILDASPNYVSRS